MPSQTTKSANAPEVPEIIDALVEENQPKKKPFHSFNVGPIIVSYWQYETAEGRPFIKTSLERYYRTEKGPGYSNQYDENELLLMAKVAGGKAHDKLLELKKELREDSSSH